MVTVSFLPGFPLFSFSSHSQGSPLDHKSDSALPFQTTHRLPTVLGTQPELLAQDPSRLTQTSLSDLLCPLITVFYTSLLAHLLPGHWARDTAWPLRCVDHVSNVLYPISCQENSYSPFKTQLRYRPSSGKSFWLCAATLGLGIFTCTVLGALGRSCLPICLSA